MQFGFKISTLKIRTTDTQMCLKVVIFKNESGTRVSDYIKNKNKIRLSINNKEPYRSARFEQ
jgi:hypothetical protein